MQFEVLKGKTLADVSVNNDSDEITFTTETGQQYRLYHSQDCCESVSIDDIAGDLADLVGAPLLQAEESSSSDSWPDNAEKPSYEPDSFTWTFYKLATIKGSVTIRWYGSSNGYYSEGVDFDPV